MTAIYSQLNTKINDILTGIDKIKVIYPYPAVKIDKYPAAIYYPTSIENSFETTVENRKTYGYKLWIVVNATTETIQNIYSTVMPNTIDEVLAGIDEGWNFDTIDGHRVWCQVSTGIWTVSEEQNGIDVAAEIDLTIKTLTTN